jgi:hypothetical protein
MTTIARPAAHWRAAAKPYAERIERAIGAVVTPLAEEILAEAMQAAADSQWSPRIVELIKRLEDDRK